LEKLFSHIDRSVEFYIEDLKEAVSIASVSGNCDPHHRGETIRMVKWTGQRLESLGATVEYADVGTQEVGTEGQTIPLPPVILATLGSDASKKTVLIYGHLDVQPALKSDGWDTDPFVLTRKGDQLFGRGSTDDKGPVLGWIHALEGMRALGQEVPVNIRFCLEGMEESGSQGLEELLKARKDTDFIRSADYVCISDNYWLGKNKPCLTYGLRGCCEFFAEVKCATRDLHSGVFGGSVHEAMIDLVAILNTLLDKDRNIQVEGLMDDVAPVTEKERSRYTDIDFDVTNFRENDVGSNGLIHQEKADILMSRWRMPALSIHGIEGAFSEPGSKTVIPSKVIGKFSIRIVPNQTIERVEKCVVEYLNREWAKLKSPNDFKVTPLEGAGRYWLVDPDSDNFSAGKKAIEEVYGVEPDLVRSGGSIPITLTLEEVTGKDVLLLPMGACDDGAHSQNEKINLRNYIEGTKVMAAYLYQLSQL